MSSQIKKQQIKTDLVFDNNQIKLNPKKVT